MDRQESDSKVIDGGKQSNFSLLLGNWDLEVNPEGFVVRNKKEKEEWHFYNHSNGWITGVNKSNEKNPVTICLNTKGVQGFVPMLMDRDSIAQRLEDARALEEFKQERAKKRG